MKIAWLHSNFHLWTGGNKFIFEVTKRLAKLCHVDVFAQTADDKIRDIFLKQGIEFKCIGKSSTYSPFFWLFLPLHLRRDVGILERELEGYDMIVASMFPMNLAAQKTGKRYIQYCFEPYVIFHDSEFVNGWPFHKRGFARLMQVLYAKEDIHATRSAEKILTTVEGVSYWIKKVYGRDSVPTYVGVDTEFFRRKLNDDLRKRYNGNKIILHATDYTPLKRLDFIVSAMPQIVKRHPNCLLLITHTLENRGAIRRLSNMIRNLHMGKNVQMIGFVNTNELPFYYSLADVCLYTGIGSGASSNSLFVLESMACETPVVRTNFTRDEVIHGESGYLFDPENQSEMIEYIGRILSDGEHARSLGMSGRNWVKSRYNWDPVVQKIFHVLKEAGDGANSPSR